MCFDTAKPDVTFARLHCWSRVTKAHSADAGAAHATHVSLLAFAYHDAYAVDPTVYAATYTTSTGASSTGQVNPLLGQRVHRAMKCIRGKILNHCSTINVFFVVYYTSSLGPSVADQRLCTRHPCAIKGRCPLEKNSSLKRT